MPKTLNDILEKIEKQETKRVNADKFLNSIQIIADEMIFDFRQQILQEIEEIKKRIFDDTEQAKQYILSLTPIKGDKGDRGDKGDKGERGLRGDRGEKGDPGEQGLNGKSGKDGKDGSPDTGKEIIDKINSLEIRHDLQIDAAHIRNLREYIPKQIGGGIMRGGGASLEFEVPSGDIDGSNTVFTVARLPKTNLFLFFVNGQLLRSGGTDYTLSSRTVTLNTAPPTGSIVQALYAK